MFGIASSSRSSPLRIANLVDSSAKARTTGTHSFPVMNEGWKLNAELVRNNLYEERCPALAGSVSLQRASTH